MDKKSLVSFMMVAPVAAFAGVQNWEASNGVLEYVLPANVEAGNWTSQGAANFTTQGGSLVCPVSAGNLSHNFTLPLGDYNFQVTQGSFSNAIIKLNGVWQAKKVNGKYVDKTGKELDDQNDYAKMDPITPSGMMKGMTTFDIVVYPQDKAKNFTVGEITLTLDCSFSTIKTSFNTRLTDIVDSAVVIASDDDRDTAKNLRKDYTALTVTEKNNVQTKINTIVLDNGEKLAAAYATLNLYAWNSDTAKAGDAVTNLLNVLKVKVDEYNVEANAENLAWSNFKKNTTDLNNLNAGVIRLQKQLNDVKSAIDALLIDPDKVASGEVGAYCKFITAKDIEDAQKAIDNYQAKINNAYSNLEATVSFTSEETTISAQIGKISYDTAIADWNAYTKFLEGWKTVSSEYGRIFALINDVQIPLKGGYYPWSGTNVYDYMIGQANSDLAKIYDNNKNYVINAEGAYIPNTTNRNTENANVAGAAANLATAQVDMAKRKTDMAAVYTDNLDKENASSKLSIQEANWTSAKATISTYQAGLDSKKAVMESEAFGQLSAKHQKMVSDDIAAIETALDALKKYAQDQYLANDLFVASQDFKDACKAVDNANTKYSNDAAGLNGVLGLIESFTNAKAYVETQTSTANPSISQYNLADKFDPTFNNIYAAIQLYYTEGKGRVVYQTSRMLSLRPRRCAKISWMPSRMW